MDVTERARILLVEDDENIAELIRYNLGRQGHRVVCLNTGEKVLLQVGAEPPDLILLDIMLPGMNGLDILRVLRGEERTREIPVILVTARGEEADVLAGLEAGADDYVAKPFSPRVLLARVRAVLRRRGAERLQPVAAADRPLALHGVSIDPARHRVEVEGRPVELTVTEFRILHVLAGQPGRVFTRWQIVEAVRGGDYHVTDRAVDVAVFGLRRKLGGAGELVETVRGVGYRFRE